MPRYPTGGSPHTTQTNSQIYDYGGIGSCGKQPKYQEGGHKDRIVHAHPPSRGEDPKSIRADIRTSSAKANGQYPRGSGVSDLAARDGRSRGPRLQPAIARQITASRASEFNRFSGKHELYSYRPSRKPSGK